jgi:hypothetical protein
MATCTEKRPLREVLRTLSVGQLKLDDFHPCGRRGVRATTVLFVTLAPVEGAR